MQTNSFLLELEDNASAHQDMSVIVAAISTADSRAPAQNLQQPATALPCATFSGQVTEDTLMIPRLTPPYTLRDDCAGVRQVLQQQQQQQHDSFGNRQASFSFLDGPDAGYELPTTASSEDAMPRDLCNHASERPSSILSSTRAVVEVTSTLAASFAATSRERGGDCAAIAVGDNDYEDPLPFAVSESALDLMAAGDDVSLPKLSLAADSVLNSFDALANDLASANASANANTNASAMSVSPLLQTPYPSGVAEDVRTAREQGAYAGAAVAFGGVVDEAEESVDELLSFTFEPLMPQTPEHLFGHADSATRYSQTAGGSGSAGDAAPHFAVVPHIPNLEQGTAAGEGRLSLGVMGTGLATSMGGMGMSMGGMGMSMEPLQDVGSLSDLDNPYTLPPFPNTPVMKTTYEVPSATSSMYNAADIPADIPTSPTAFLLSPLPAQQKLSSSSASFPLAPTAAPTTTTTAAAEAPTAALAASSTSRKRRAPRRKAVAMSPTASATATTGTATGTGTVSRKKALPADSTRARAGGSASLATVDASAPKGYTVDGRPRKRRRKRVTPDHEKTAEWHAARVRNTEQARRTRQLQRQAKPRKVRVTRLDRLNSENQRLKTLVSELRACAQELQGLALARFDSVPALLRTPEIVAAANRLRALQNSRRLEEDPTANDNRDNNSRNMEGQDEDGMDSSEDQDHNQE